MSLIKNLEMVTQPKNVVIFIYNKLFLSEDESMMIKKINQDYSKFILDGKFKKNF